MKEILFIGILLIPNLLSAQTSNKVYYKSDRLHSFIIQNFHDVKKATTLSDKVIGTDVEIIVDTVFKSYTINFTDEDDKRTYIKYSLYRK